MILILCHPRMKKEIARNYFENIWYLLKNSVIFGLENERMIWCPCLAFVVGRISVQMHFKK